MILTEAAIVPSGDVVRYAWAGLSRFHNVSFVEDLICRTHGLEKKDRRNARKQETQLRYTLIQAKEYFDAASSVTLATKPNLLYYSIMSLALAEILFKQTGESSLDAARAQHRHHGLSFHVANNPANADLSSSASALAAKPLIRDDSQRFGTFELWHRSAREMSLCGEVTTNNHLDGSSLISFHVILNSSDHRIPLVPADGLNLLECLRSLPGMHEFLPSFGVLPDTVRGKITRHDMILDQANVRSVYNIALHPSHSTLIDRLVGNIFIRADQAEQFNLRRFQQGGIITHTVTSTVTSPGGFETPNGSSWRKEEIRLWPITKPLNEFGYLYVALYIAGNYARYYPDKWLRDVEQNSPLALAVTELVHYAEQRMALLAYSELARTYYVIED